MKHLRTSMHEGLRFGSGASVDPLIAPVGLGLARNATQTIENSIHKKGLENTMDYAKKGIMNTSRSFFIPQSEKLTQVSKVETAPLSKKETLWQHNEPPVHASHTYHHRIIGDNTREKSKSHSEYSRIQN